MDSAEIRTKIKKIIGNVINRDPQKIPDDASFIDDLGLDSLSMLEIGVDVDYEFKLGVPEERLQGLRSIQDTVDLIEQVLTEKAGALA
jgi:acyl carrier protein